MNPGAAGLSLLLSENGREVARALAAYIVEARGKPVAAESRQAAFKCILDLMSAAGAGVDDPGAVAVRETALSTMKPGTVPIWFSGQFSSVAGAAWANSAASSALDLDDGHRLARGHPGAAVIPTALAVAHETGAGFEDLLTAIVIGYEVGITIGAARRTYGNTGTWSAYAVVATAAALRGTPVEIIQHAMAIAGESSPNQAFASAPPQTPPPEGSDVKEGIPWSVVTGLVALELAVAGHTGPRNILGSRLHYNFPAELRPGSVQHICNTYFKLYACCRHIHAPLDALKQLLDRHSIDANEIDAIEVQTYAAALRISNLPRPANLVDIQYSIPYCVALVAFMGSRALLPIMFETPDHGVAAELASKVKLSVDPLIDARFPRETLARVLISSNGRLYVSELTAPQGDAANPLSFEALERKFYEATRLVATTVQQERLLTAFGSFRAGRMDALTECLETTVLAHRKHPPAAADALADGHKPTGERAR